MSGRAATTSVIPGKCAVSVGRADMSTPPGWTWSLLTDIARLETGHTPSRKHPEYWDGGNIAWIGIKDARLNHGRTIHDTFQKVTQLGIDNSASRLLPTGTVCLSRTASVGYVLVMGRDMATSQDFVNWICSDALLPEFLKFALMAEDENLLRFGKGTTHTTIYFPEVKAFHICHPPFHEQRRIVAKLEEMFSDLDAGVAALKRAQANLKRYRAAVLKAAVEGRLTEKWRAEHPDVEPADKLLARILAERRRRWIDDQLTKWREKKHTAGWPDTKIAAAESDELAKITRKYREPAAADSARLPELLASWRWSTLGQCFNVAVGATPSRREARFWSGSIPWVSSGEVQFCRIRATEEHITIDGLENSSTQLNPAGSVLLGMIGEGKTRGQAAILDIDACNNQNCAAIWVPQTSIPPEFIYYWLYSQYEITRQLGSGNNQPALNKTRVEAIPFPVPPLEEQLEVVKLIDERLSIIDAAEAETRRAFQRAARLRQSILKRAFEGKLVPQDPNDEPADALLERIRSRSAHEAEITPKSSPRTRRISSHKRTMK